MPSILVTGGSGQVGTELARFAWPSGWSIVTPDRAALNLEDPASLAAVVAAGGYAAVINAGAYTAVDRAEEEAVRAWTVNALAPAALAAACRTAGIPLVQVSTDYVFDGGKSGAWAVDDPTVPLGVYGASKLGGELAVRASGARHAIVRTAWVISAHGHNFVKTMLRLAAERDTLRVVADQRGAPTSAADLAQVLAVIAMRLVEDADAPTGTFHFSNAGATHWAELAETVFAGARARGAPTAAVEPIGTVDYPTPAARPANSLLATQTLTRDYGIVPRPWRIALEEILDELLGAAK